MPEVTCPDCRETFSFAENRPPRFCQACGQPLQGGDLCRARSSHLPPSHSPPSRHDPDRIETATIPPDTPPGPSSTSDSSVGGWIGPYRLIRYLGCGGMGVVWEAEEEGTGRRVAVKQLSTSLTADAASHDRFLREAQLAARIAHPNVTFIYGVGEDRGTPYIAMELMPGTTLQDLLNEQGTLEPRIAVDRMIEAIDGLAATHEVGLIHRDVKPSNCFLTEEATVKIGDFGLSKSMHTTDTHLTKTGTFMGTPCYSAPEQIRGAELDVRTDVYAVGATLFTLVMGRAPFVGDALAVTAQIVSDPPPSPRELNHRVPADLDAIILKCLEKDPARRFPDLESLKLALIPFASQGTSLANFGRRVSAFMTDYLLIQVAVVLLTFPVAAWLAWGAVGDGREAVASSVSRSAFAITLIGWIALVTYFTISEWRFGRTLGKWLMGLIVVDRRGQRPRLRNAALRAFVLPGCAGVIVAVSAYQTFWLPTPVDAAGQFMSGLVSTAVLFGAFVVCLIPMRIRNDFRGLHGFLSGTRVVKTRSSHPGRIQLPRVQPTANTIREMTFGPYRTNELLGTSQRGQVYLGFDDTLNRRIWIVASGEGNGPPTARLHLSRPGRQRWLAGGDDPQNGRWDALQAVDGLPLQALVGIQRAVGWEQYRAILQQLAEELLAALEDGTLPDELTLPQVWVDDKCRMVLIDRRLVNLVQSDSELRERESDCNDSERAVRLLKEAGSLVMRTRGRELPRSAREFLNALPEKPADISTLQWALAELELLSQKLGDLRWDSRAGVLGTTMVVEFLVYTVFAAGLFLVAFNFLHTHLALRFAAGLAASLALPVGFGFWLRGGPVFAFMEINVCNLAGQPASRWQCGWRSLVAWLAPLAFTGMLVLMSVIGESHVNHFAVEDSLNETIQGSDYFAVALLFLAIGVFSLILAGLLFSLKSPRRGLQDYAAGTQLIPD